MRNLLFVAAVIALVGCNKDNKSAKEAEEEDPALSFVAKGAAEGVAKIKAAIAAGAPGDAFFSCAHTANIDVLKESKPHRELAKELVQLCDLDLPLAVITQGTEKAEAARKAKPDEKLLTECYNAEINVALDQMRKAKTDANAKDALTRFAVVCPEASAKL